jgi:hypothetical protein
MSAEKMNKSLWKTMNKFEGISIMEMVKMDHNQFKNTRNKLITIGGYE